MRSPWTSAGLCAAAVVAAVAIVLLLSRTERPGRGPETSPGPADAAAPAAFRRPARRVPPPRVGGRLIVLAPDGVRVAAAGLLAEGGLARGERWFEDGLEDASGDGIDVPAAGGRLLVHAPEGWERADPPPADGTSSIRLRRFATLDVEIEPPPERDVRLEIAADGMPWLAIGPTKNALICTRVVPGDVGVVLFDADGRRVASASTEVESGGRARLVLRPGRPDVLRVRVVDEAQRPVAGASVSIQARSGPDVRTLTDADGSIPPFPLDAGADALIECVADDARGLQGRARVVGRGGEERDVRLRLSPGHPVAVRWTPSRTPPGDARARVVLERPDFDAPDEAAPVRRVLDLAETSPPARLLLPEGRWVVSCTSNCGSVRWGPWAFDVPGDVEVRVTAPVAEESRTCEIVTGPPPEPWSWEWTSRRTDERTATTIVVPVKDGVARVPVTGLVGDEAFRLEGRYGEHETLIATVSAEALAGRRLDLRPSRIACAIEGTDLPFPLRGRWRPALRGGAGTIAWLSAQDVAVVFADGISGVELWGPDGRFLPEGAVQSAEGGRCVVRARTAAPPGGRRRCRVVVKGGFAAVRGGQIRLFNVDRSADDVPYDEAGRATAIDDAVPRGVQVEALGQVRVWCASRDVPPPEGEGGGAPLPEGARAVLHVTVATWLEPRDAWPGLHDDDRVTDVLKDGASLAGRVLDALAGDALSPQEDAASVRLLLANGVVVDDVPLGDVVRHAMVSVEIAKLELRPDAR